MLTVSGCILLRIHLEEFQPGQPLSVPMERTASASTGGEPVRIMAVLQNGFDNRTDLGSIIAAEVNWAESHYLASESGFPICHPLRWKLLLIAGVFVCQRLVISTLR